jgi:hypothetical protein
MSRSEAIDLLRRHDPARALDPLSPGEGELVRDRILAAPPPRASAGSRRPARAFALAATVAVAAVVGVGVAWAAGTWSPLQLFQANPEYDNGSAGALWNQHVVPGSVVEAATVELPRVGRVRFWYGNTAQRGWCAALRLPSGAWVGTGKDPVDAGGAVPGCFPTREQINSSGKPVYEINGFDYVEDEIDARSLGGAFWRIRYGLVTAAGAVRVADLVSGRAAAVVHGDLFVLPVPDATPNAQTPVHLVAYDAAGNVVADDSRRP